MLDRRTTARARHMKVVPTLNSIVKYFYGDAMILQPARKRTREAKSVIAGILASTGWSAGILCHLYEKQWTTPRTD
jgi:hypothetical protein